MISDDIEQVELTSQDALWAWLDANHDQGQSVWLVTWKAAHQDKYLSRDQVLDALIAYGWIDGRRMKLDDARTMQLIAPRTQQAWAVSYKTRATRLEAEGRMRDAGRAAIAASKAAGQWDAAAHVDRLEDPIDLRAALHHAGGLTWWDAAAPSYRRNILRWIDGAKQQATRAKRIDAAAAHAACGEKVPNY